MYVSFCDQGYNKIRLHTFGKFKIRVRLHGRSYFDYMSTRISNNMPMLLALATQTFLRAMTEKDLQNYTVTFKRVGIAIPPMFRVENLYYKQGRKKEYFVDVRACPKLH